MLNKEQNELVTRTDAGTPMGELFRRYWLPALLSEELPAPDCAPVRVQLLGERLIAIRDTQGRLGVMDEFCAHRGVSLWFGRNEENGLRCPYHGWKFDVNGQCVDVPSEPEGSRLCDKVKLKSYPLIERGGVVWIYMGPPEHQPPAPEWEFATVPTEQSFMSKRLQECNWLQALEGGIDSSHVSFLHRGGLSRDPLFKGAKGNDYNMQDLRPQFEVAEAEGGLLIGVSRKAEAGKLYWRITPWVMPCFTMVPPRGDHPIHGHFWVPIDDENCTAWSFDYHPTRPLTDTERQAMKDGKGIHVKYVPGTYRPLANKDNDYLMDRAAQKAGTTYSGVEGIDRSVAREAWIDERLQMKRRGGTRETHINGRWIRIVESLTEDRLMVTLRTDITEPSNYRATRHLDQWLKARGVRVIGTVGSPDKVPLAQACGAEVVFLSDDPELVAKVRETTGGKGVRVSYDGVGMANWRTSLDCMAPRGTIASFGNASGPVTGVALRDLATRGSLFVTRPGVYDYYRDPEEARAGAARVWEMVAKGVLKVSIGQTYALTDAAQAHIDLEARKTVGSTLLLP